MSSRSFSTDCKDCERLSRFLSDVKTEHPDYFCKPVPAFGDPSAKLLIVGLAPGKHGANATGRPFTGDYAGILLYDTLHKHGFSNQPTSEKDDDLKLINCRITNAVKCLPPDNKPLPVEVNTCNVYLKQELEELPKDAIVIALGGIAHKAVIKAIGEKQSAYTFAHNLVHALPNFKLIDSYHCSRYNTQTKRLTAEMFSSVFENAKRLMS